MKKTKKYYFRKTHRWLGVIIGIQFLMWTLSGLYFSWTDIDEIHGEQFLVPTSQAATLSALTSHTSDLKVSDLALRFIDDRPYLWINSSMLMDPASGEVKLGVSQEEAQRIARRHVNDDHQIGSITLLREVGAHHEYRGRPLPVWAVTFIGPSDLTAYVAQRDGSFQRVRHQSWRIFDFLWMLHTMDYEGRDDFNNLLLRAFSLFGLFIVASGFILFFVSRRRKPRTVVQPRAESLTLD
jgi:uncharacterized iron-regulated membrane protein